MGRKRFVHVQENVFCFGEAEIWGLIKIMGPFGVCIIVYSL